MVPEQAGEQGGREGVAPGGRIYATPRRVESTPTRPVRARCTREDLGSRASDRAATTARGWQVVLNPPRSGAHKRVPAARHEDVAPGARPVAVAPLNDAETERAAAPAFAAAATRGGGGLVGPLDGAPVRRAVGAARRSRRHRPGPPLLPSRRGLDRPPWSGTSCPRGRLRGDSAGLTAIMAGREGGGAARHDTRAPPVGVVALAARPPDEPAAPAAVENFGTIDFLNSPAACWMRRAKAS